ncbi:unnamed protein product [Brassica oleracea var. botrytis]
MLDVSAVAILVDGVDNRESFVVIGGREFRGGIVSEGGKCSGRPQSAYPHFTRGRSKLLHPLSRKISLARLSGISIKRDTTIGNISI